MFFGLKHLYSTRSRVLQLIFTRQIKVLGIESTCDDTCASVVTDNRETLSDVRASQLHFNIELGGVLPVFTRSRHLLNLNPIVSQALHESGCTMKDIDAISIANEPGLVLSLEAGVDYAKKLCIKYKKPLIPVHHMEAHALMATMTNKKLKFPFLTLLISGGHSLLAIAAKIDQFYLLGQTLDNAIGEVLDKIARHLKIKNLGFPYNKVCGGEAIELSAKHASNKIPDFKNSYKNDCNFHFAYFRTLVEKITKEEKYRNLPPDCPFPYYADICAQILYSIAFQICTKIHRAIVVMKNSNILDEIENNSKIYNVFFDLRERRFVNIQLVISGGVARNNFIVDFIKNYISQIQSMEEDIKIEVILPEPRNLTTDNGVMIAWNGMLKLLNKENLKKKVLLENETDIISLPYVADSPLGMDISYAIANLNIKINPPIN